MSTVLLDDNRSGAPRIQRQALQRTTLPRIWFLVSTWWFLRTSQTGAALGFGLVQNTRPDKGWKLVSTEKYDQVIVHKVVLHGMRKLIRKCDVFISFLKLQKETLAQNLNLKVHAASSREIALGDHGVALKAAWEHCAGKFSLRAIELGASWCYATFLDLDWSGVGWCNSEARFADLCKCHCTLWHGDMNNSGMAKNDAGLFNGSFLFIILYHTQLKHDSKGNPVKPAKYCLKLACSKESEPKALWRQHLPSSWALQALVWEQWWTQ